MLQINRVAVIGAGTMGGAIAAHLANCHIPVLLLDIVPKGAADHPQARSGIAINAITKMIKAKIAPFYLPELRHLITPGNLEDDFDKLSEVDWIIEAVPEDPAIKIPLLERLDKICKPSQIVTSNTSGLSINTMVAGRSETFTKNFFVTHFFNPPRYMHLMELVKTDATDNGLFDDFIHFARQTLGKGVVVAKDTPNFIANRIGVFDIANTMSIAASAQLSIETVDLLMGPLCGRPKSGIYRLVDMIGIDVAAYVNGTLYKLLPADPHRELFGNIDLLKAMIGKGYLGEKCGAGFYKKSVDADGKREILVLDTKTMSYRKQEKPDLPQLKAVKKLPKLGARINALMADDSNVGKFVWQQVSDTLLYAAQNVPDISDEIAQIDNAMRWGFNWELGPFELFDAIGVMNIVTRLKEEGRDIPPLITKLINKGFTTFYQQHGSCLNAFDFASESYLPVDMPNNVLSLPAIRTNNQVVEQGEGGSIVDLGDEVLGVEFHSRANSISREVLALIAKAIALSSKSYRGIVIGNQGTHFSLGADLKEMIGAVESGQFEVIDQMINNFQQTMLQIKYADVPVVAALRGMCLGGGCEVAMHSHHRVAANETYIGLVELGVGLIPAAGGCKEWIIKSNDWTAACSDVHPFPMINQAFETVGMAKASTSAPDARKIGYLTSSDDISVNKDSLIYNAKQSVLTRSTMGFTRKKVANTITVLGTTGVGEFKVRLNVMRQGGFISKYDELLGNKVAYVLCGGNVPDLSTVNEQYILDLERETFLSLLGQEKTQQRIMHTLKTGKPLRN